MLSPGILTGRFQPTTTLRIQEEMDKIPYIKYARYVMSIKQDSFGLSGSLRYAEDNYKLYFVFEEE